MTLTRHGHHIEGSPTTDENPNASRARCGGPGLCPVCGNDESAYRHRKKEMPNSMPGVEMTASVNGTGQLHPSDLTNFLASLPADAIITGSAGGQRNDGWYFQARWGNPQSTNRVTPPVAHRVGDSVSRSTAAQINSGYVGPYGDGVAFPGDH